MTTQAAEREESIEEKREETTVEKREERTVEKREERTEGKTDVRNFASVRIIINKKSADTADFLASWT